MNITKIAFCQNIIMVFYSNQMSIEDLAIDDIQFVELVLVCI